MATWYEQDRERCAIELDLMAKKTTARLYENEGKLYWLESILSETHQLYRIKIEHPPRFPYERPRAFIEWPNISRAPHRFHDGSLCLFRNPSACDVKITALVVRNRTAVWILCYELWVATGEWMAPQH